MSQPTKEDYAKLTLEHKPWTSKKNGNSGNTWCFNNSGKESIDCFGHSATISISKAGQSFDTASKDSVFIWLNDMTGTEAELFMEEYCDTIYIHVPTKELLTVAQYDELFSTTSQQASQQPSTSF